MITELKSEDRKKIIRLIKNTQHELTIEASIEGTAPSHIYVDNVSAPTSGLIKTPECNVIFGDPNNSKFNTQILDEIDYYDSITCDDTDWNEFIENNHYNCAIKKFKRHYYQLKKQHFNSDKVIVDKTKIDIVTSNTLKAIAYENAEVIHNWININNLEA